MRAKANKKPVTGANEEALALCREEFVDLDVAETAETTEMAETVKATAETTAEKAETAEIADAETTTDITAPYSPDRSITVFKQPGLIALSELAEILPTLNRISSWIEAVFAYVKGYKVVEGRSVRTFTDVKAVVKTATDNGYTNIYKQQLISLTEFEKLMGKKRFAELLGKYIIKPPGKLSLVPESDPRPAVEIESKTTPAQEFDVLPVQEDF